ncbi:TetR/AcrR family transcriptional regulator [Aeromicrobium sp. UC242_57]|uniref:TetR/AcrR family transcriptional regulator n=1 Tax=Aeromicrobium sp. UC242_57 TaxID=3374624 RepID=UPI0037BD4E47
MTGIQGKRVGRPSSGKTAARRAQLAESALMTLGELGYARTSLRNIADNSDFSHGVVHYYFRDKTDLIAHGVRHYKTQCATRYDEIIDTATTSAELGHRFLDKLGETLVHDDAMHRLWYDLRNQSQFDEELRRDVLEVNRLLEDMIWRILSRFAELRDQHVLVDRAVAYATFDGLFQQALLAHFNGELTAAADLKRQVVSLLAVLLGSEDDPGTVCK